MLSGGLSQPPKHQWGSQLEGVNTAIHTKGFIVGGKNFGKKIWTVAFFYSTFGWVGGYVYRAYSLP